MVTGKLKEKISDAIVELHDSILSLRDYHQFPVVLESVINKLFPIDWLSVGFVNTTGKSVSNVTNPCLPFDWNEKYIEIIDIDRIRINTLNLPAGGTFRYFPDLYSGCEQMEYALEFTKKHTDTVQFLTLHSAKTDHWDSLIGFYRTENKFRFSRQDQQILDYLSPILISISNTLMFYSSFDYKRAAIDALRNEPDGMPVILDEFLRVVDLPLNVETFLSKYFPETGHGSLPDPIAG